MPGVDPPYGAYAAVAGRRRRAGGRAVAPLHRRGRGGGAPAGARRRPRAFHWGRWFTSAARACTARARTAGKPGEAIGYAGAGALALLDDRGLSRPGQRRAPARWSPTTASAPTRSSSPATWTEPCTPWPIAPPTMPRSAAWRPPASCRATCPAERWSRFDVDTPLDLALLRLATRLPGTRVLDGVVTAFLETAIGPDGGALEVPHLERHRRRHP